MNIEFAEKRSEPLVGLNRNILVAKEDYLVGNQRIMNCLEGVFVEWFI